MKEDVPWFFGEMFLNICLIIVSSVLSGESLFCHMNQPWDFILGSLEIDTPALSECGVERSPLEGKSHLFNNS